MTTPLKTETRIIPPPAPMEQMPLEPVRPARPSRLFYISIPAKFTLALIAAAAWMALSIWLSLAWLNDLGLLIGKPLALYLVAFIAYVPGFMNAFLIASLLLDRRPPRVMPTVSQGVSVLVPCYNEAKGVADTIKSLALQTYPGEVEYLILDDGSTDMTLAIAQATIAELPDDVRARFRIIAGERNRGKAGLLNFAFPQVRHRLVATVDGDCWIAAHALERIVQRYLSDPPDTRAVAGTILVRNSRKNWMTRVQEWDYFHGIAAVKRMQSMYHGTLVAQGAFSLYDAALLRKVGGWPECVGEDIVVSWAILDEGYRIGHCEDAIMFTNVPESFSAFAHQRRRWSRGLVEAFLRYSDLLFARRLSTLFIWWNLLFLPMDLAYTFGFIPGLILACFGYYYIAGVMTLVLLPLAMICNAVMLASKAACSANRDCASAATFSASSSTPSATAWCCSRCRSGAISPNCSGRARIGGPSEGTAFSSPRCVWRACRLSRTRAGEPTQAAGVDVFVSSDADHSDVLKLGLTYDFDYTNIEHYMGARLESFSFSAPGTHRTEGRGYFTFAGQRRPLEVERHGRHRWGRCAGQCQPLHRRELPPGIFRLARSSGDADGRAAKALRDLCRRVL